MPLKRLTQVSTPTEGYVQFELPPFTRDDTGRYAHHIITHITLNPNGTHGPQIEFSGEIDYLENETRYKAILDSFQSDKTPVFISRNDKSHKFNIAIPWGPRYIPTFNLRSIMAELSTSEEDRLNTLIREAPTSTASMFAAKIKAAKNPEDFNNLFNLANKIQQDQILLKKHYSQFNEKFEIDALYVLAKEIAKEKGRTPFFNKVFINALLQDESFNDQQLNFLEQFNTEQQFTDPKFAEKILREATKTNDTNLLQQKISLQLLSMDKSAEGQREYLENLFSVKKTTGESKGESKTEFKDIKDTPKDAKATESKDREGQIEQAMKHAEKLTRDGNKDAWFILGDFLKNQNLFFQATKALTKVPSDSTYYSMAQIECANIYYHENELLAQLDPEFRSLDKEDSNIKVLETALRMAARANDPDLASMIYLKLIGKEISVKSGSRGLFERRETPITAQNVESVIEDARITRELRKIDQEKIKTLEAEVAALRAKLETKAAVAAIAQKGMGITQTSATEQTKTGVTEPPPKNVP